MAFSNFENLLKESMGLDAASIGRSAIERAVRERQQASHLADTSAYWDLVRGSQAELQALIETVVVPETWFFRDGGAFAALGRVAQDEWLRAHPQRVLRMLSLPCATGEEPYSMAMALLSAGVPASRFRIDAVDISERVLTYARDGMYGKSSFRGSDQMFRDCYFEPTGRGHRIKDAVRRQVDFHQGNLFNAAFLPGVEIYDVIFCRNVLISFDGATQDRAVGVISRLLTEKGILFVGSSEAGVFLNHGFVPARMPMAFAFRRAEAVPVTSGPIAVDPPSGAVRRPSLLPVVSVPVTRDRRVTPAPVGPQIQAAAAPNGGLREASELANQGRFVEAALCCEDHLRQHGPSAEAFHLMGLVRDASGSSAEAAAYYRKTLYLDPQHHEALIHLALLMEKLNKKAEAQVLRARAGRLTEKSGMS